MVSKLFASVDDAAGRVREFMRDEANFNALLAGQETSGPMMKFAVELAIDDFNSSPPLIGDFKIDTHPSHSLLLMGAVIWVLKSAGIIQSRNQLDYASGGVTVALSNKTPLYQSWINAFMQEYEAKKGNLKKSLNAEQAYGGVHSEYVNVNFGAHIGYIGMDSLSLVRNGIFA